MTPALTLPPSYRDCPLPPEGDLFEAARREALAGAEPGCLFHQRHAEELRFALLLAPERSLRDSLAVVYPLQLALADALGATLPPQVAVHLRWPDRLLLNGALFARLHLLAPAPALDEIPAWLLAGFDLRLAGAPEGEGATLKTSLEAENLSATAPSALLESFARHFLTWLHRWEQDGTAALGPHYFGRFENPGKPATYPAPDACARGGNGTNGAPDSSPDLATGLARGFDRYGGLELESDGQVRVLELDRYLAPAAPTGPQLS